MTQLNCHNQELVSLLHEFEPCNPENELYSQEVGMSFFFPILCPEAINGHVSQKALSMCIVSSSANICLLKTHLNRTIFARPMVDPVASYPVC